MLGFSSKNWIANFINRCAINLMNTELLGVVTTKTLLKCAKHHTIWFSCFEDVGNQTYWPYFVGPPSIFFYLFQNE